MGVPPPRVLVVEHELQTTLDRMAVLPGCSVEVVRPAAGERLPDRLFGSGWGGVLVLGGEMAAWEDDVAPWLPAVRALLRRAVQERVPTLGICLGAQLLAMATGGRVRRGASGPEVGVLRVELARAARRDPFTSRLPPVVLAPQGHRDAVTSLPPGAVLLGSSVRYPHQVFRVGPAAWGVQYHPEVSRPVFATWLEGHRGDLAAWGGTPEHELAVFDAHDVELLASACLHAVAFADVVLASAAARAATAATAPDGGAPAATGAAPAPSGAARAAP